MENQERFAEIRHRQVATNGITMHIAEQGDLSAPPVLLLHGFPELWLSWRHQMAALAANGYRAIAPDLRGYGDTEAPADAAAYTVFHIIGDLIGLLDHLELPCVFVVGHDWGANMAWHLCQFRPERVRALVNIGVPYFPRSPSIKPTELFFKVFGDGCYIHQFQEPGRAEASFARYEVSTVLKKFFSIKMDNLSAPPGMEIIDFLEELPSPLEWISEDELQYLAEKFQKNGFTGPLNYYRNFDKNWELMAPWQGAKIEVPTKFILVKRDIGYNTYGTEMMVKGGGIKEVVPNLDVVSIDGYHFIQQEKAEEVTSEILSYFKSKT
ncbi:bifunctional epoxide hydrolase 2-like protein [Carex littledalei]|uniref:soluble epoxide hydrolase n=1 Tax=Carex littledalei TaxID=544730 RepID=A0A833R4D7_9POAL|nr:bifunctional epoxide hydrolase 2-like protein [Carex littledalei]